MSEDFTEIRNVTFRPEVISAAAQACFTLGVPVRVWRCPEEECDWWGEEPFWSKLDETRKPLCQIAGCPGVCEEYEAFRK